MIQAHLGMLLWALLVGLSFPAVGLMSTGLPPLSLTALRFTLAALVIWPLLPRDQAWSPGRRGLLLYGLMGLCLAGFFGTMFWAAHRVSALSMSTLYVSVPLLAYGLGRILAVERRDFRLVAILGMGAVGALAIAWAEGGANSESLAFSRSEALFFLGCVASAGYPVLSKWGLEDGSLSPSAALRTFWSLVIGAMLIALLGLAFDDWRALGRIIGIDVLVLTYLAVFSSGMTFWLQQRATADLTPGVVTGYSYMVPFVSMLLIFMSEPERIGWAWLPGGLLVSLAIILLFVRDSLAATRDRRRSPVDA